MKIITTIIVSTIVSVSCILAYIGITNHLEHQKDLEWKKRIFAGIIPTYQKIQEEKTAGKSHFDNQKITPDTNRQLYQIKEDMMEICADLDRGTRRFKTTEKTKTKAAELLVEFQFKKRPFMPTLLDEGIPQKQAIFIDNELRNEIKTGYIASLSDWEMAVLCIQHIMDKSTSGGWGKCWDGTHGDIAYQSVSDGSGEKVRAKAYSALSRGIQFIIDKYQLDGEPKGLPSDKEISKINAKTAEIKEETDKVYSDIGDVYGKDTVDRIKADAYKARHEPKKEMRLISSRFDPASGMLPPVDRSRAVELIANMITPRDAYVNVKMKEGMSKSEANQYVDIRRDSYHKSLNNCMQDIELYYLCTIFGCSKADQTPDPQFCEELSALAKTLTTEIINSAMKNLEKAGQHADAATDKAFKNRI